VSSDTTTTGAEAEQLLRDAGALLEGHFQLASGKHSSLYIEKFRLLERPPQTEALCGMIAEWASDLAPGVVAGPTTGGIIISYEVARLMGLRGIFAERNEVGPGRSFQRGFDIAQGERVLIVDDVLTTGGSIREVIDAVGNVNGGVAGVAVLVDRAGGAADFGVPFFACLALELPVYEPDACPLCDEGIPLKIT
jgi:orotate phosphoribosyltransferase